MIFQAIAISALAIWLYLIAGRGGFWRCRERDDVPPPEPSHWPRVTAVVPARNEAEGIAACIGSLMRQDYPGAFSIVLVDDDSDDDTEALAKSAAVESKANRSLTVVRSNGVAPGWTGKVWALSLGVSAANSANELPEYFLFTDADIVHAPESVRALVARAESGRYVLVSLMARLRCETLAECAHVPAFVYFFQMLFPFAWANNIRRPTAAAAGGCMLLKSEALARAGGVESIRGALIDDCSLAKRMKDVGPIWLGLTDRVFSIRPYDWTEARKMVSRSAYAQLDHSPLMLIGCTFGMALTFIAAPLLTVLGGGWVQLLSAVTWFLMVMSFQPMLGFYRLSPLWGLALPAIALAYMVYTLNSAWCSVRGRGGEWKGRVQASSVSRS